MVPVSIVMSSNWTTVDADAEGPSGPVRSTANRQAMPQQYPSGVRQLGKEVAPRSVGSGLGATDGRSDTARLLIAIMADLLTANLLGGMSSASQSGLHPGITGRGTDSDNGHCEYTQTKAPRGNSQTENGTDGERDRRRTGQTDLVMGTGVSEYGSLPRQPAHTPPWERALAAPAAVRTAVPRKLKCTFCAKASPRGLPC